MMNTDAPHETQPTSLLDLFRSEVDHHTAAIRETLSTFDEPPVEAAAAVDTLLQASRAIKGGAKIIGSAPADELASALERCFGTVKQTPGTLPSRALDTLNEALALLQELAHVAPEARAEWQAAQHARLTETLDQLAHIHPQNPAPPAEVPQAPPTANETAAPADKEAASSTPETGGAPAASATVSINFSSSTADDSMLDLFRTEVETHAAVLTEGLLALENRPESIEHLESLMRAAHSIKGGARVVELDAVVHIAHIMEDCFVAAQNSQLTLTSDHIDILLQGVDLLTGISATSGNEIGAWLHARQGQIIAVVQAIQAILSGEPLPEPAGPAAVADVEPAEPAPERPSAPARGAPMESNGGAAATPQPAASPPEPVSDGASTLSSSGLPAEERDRMIRVTATKIERLMGLGGEVVVSARWLPQFSESLLSLKKAHNDLFALLEKLQELLGDDEEYRQMRGLTFQAREKTRECSLSLADHLNQLDMFTSTSANLSDRLYHEVIGVRMRPFADGVQRFPRMVRDLAKQLGKKVRLEIIGKSTDVDRDILEKLDAPLTHLIRNAIDHGVESPEARQAADKPETGILRLEAVHRSGMLMITFSDDGRGIDLARLRQKILDKGMANASIVDNLSETELMEFLFLPGFSTSEAITEISGRGVGLDVVHDMVHEVGGVIRAVSSPGEGTSFHLELPLTLSVIRTFLVEIAGEPYAFPLARIDRCLVVEEEELEDVEDRQYFRFDNTNIALVDIHDILEIDESASHTHGLPVVVISDRSNAYGVLVDKFIGECDLVVRPIDPRLGKVPDISAVAVMLDGAPVLIFDVDDMLRSVDKMVNVKRLRRVREEADEHLDTTPARRVLVVDDSITVREMERKILENQGYHVDVAVDGMDGWNAVRTEGFDLVVSDIDMPRMNGIELVNHIKQHDELHALPVIIISYKDTEEHRLQGLEAGANYYLTKSSFQDDSFINAVVDLIGEA